MPCFPKAKRLAPVRHLAAFLVFCAIALAGSRAAVAACGSAFCMVNTNWNIQGVWAEPGTRLDLRFEYIDQDQPRAGSDRVAVGEIPRHHDEVSTLNRNWIATLDHMFSSAWGVSVSLPVAGRDHTHIHNHAGEQELEKWDFTRIGDVRVLGRHQFSAGSDYPLAAHAWGISFGLKLPTGKFDVTNSAGEEAERTLQPGTGTTDALLGAYYHHTFPGAAVSWFVQGLLQRAINSRDDYRPGQQVSLDLGLRYDAGPRIGLMLQLNALARDRDRGAQAEPEDSGGKFVTLSPGIAVAFTGDFQVYGFLQKPVYQYVNGVQLTSDWSAVLGMSYRF
jgi:Putative MetA-pathway of phenol degradation